MLTGEINEGLSEEGAEEEKEQEAAPEEEQIDTQEGQEENSRTDGEDNVLKRASQKSYKMT